MADIGERPGGGGRPRLFLDQTDPQRAERIFFEYSDWSRIISVVNPY